MRGTRILILVVATLVLAACVAQIPTETRERTRRVAVLSLIGSEVRHVDREWWREPYVEEVCINNVGRDRRTYRQCWLEVRYRTVSRVLAIHDAQLGGVDIDGAAPALLRDRLRQVGATLTIVPARYPAPPPDGAGMTLAAAAELPPDMVEQLRSIAATTAADTVLVLQGECAGPAGGCRAASLERSRPAGGDAPFSSWGSTSRFHAWLFDPVKGAVVSRWTAPELRVVRAAVDHQPVPPEFPGAATSAFDPAAAGIAVQAIRYGLAELADDFACAMQGLRACPAESGAQPAR